MPLNMPPKSSDVNELFRTNAEEKSRALIVRYAAFRTLPDVAGAIFGGSGEIRTHERLTPSAVFKTAAFNHSATLPMAQHYTEFNPLMGNRASLTINTALAALGGLRRSA